MKLMLPPTSLVFRFQSKIFFSFLRSEVFLVTNFITGGGDGRREKKSREKFRSKISLSESFLCCSKLQQKHLLHIHCQAVTKNGRAGMGLGSGSYSNARALAIDILPGPTFYQSSSALF